MKRKKNNIQFGGDYALLMRYVDSIPKVSRSNTHITNLCKYTTDLTQIIRIAKDNDRYLEFGNMSRRGYSEDTFKEECATLQRNGADKTTCDKSKCCVYRNECVYDKDLCMGYQNVVSYDDYKKFILKFYNSEIPGTPIHPGPWNFETSLILDKLKSIVTDTPYVPNDSQPGMVVYNNPNYMDGTIPYIQIPYMFLIGTTHHVNQLLHTIYESSEFSNIRMMDDSLDAVNLKNHFPAISVRDAYVTIGLCVPIPDLLDPKFLTYIFTNAFFDDVYRAAIISMQ